ncbi:hypothetical protein [Gordonia oryzae]|uniref:hypothetical protein n=1 Tax=Gordonia oryzae TaxID=2487349 RepID=UPI001FE3FCEE|nr:hypothetical protein [Gordonia oryzae]
MRSAAVLHLGLADHCHGLVGIFDSEGKDLPATEIRALGLLAGQLSTLAKTLPGGLAPGGATDSRHVSRRLRNWSATVGPTTRSPDR